MANCACFTVQLTVSRPGLASCWLCFKGKKVNVPLTHTKAQKGGGINIALLFLDLGPRRGWVVSTTPRPLYPGKDPEPIVQEAL
jgi:hypothetical protein